VTIGHEAFQVFQVSTGDTLPLRQAVDDLRTKRIILVGEYHASAAHHAAQLAVIRALHDAGLDLAVGMEMFRADSQASLDQWVDGRMATGDFKKVYYDNWNFDWNLYRPILEYTRQNRIPLVGLNAPKGITRKVSREGFASLNAAERGKLKNVTCRVDQTYEQYIRKAFGAHAHGDLNFTYFCEAQLVWDTVMAINALDHLAAHPGRTIVLLTGTGHAHKRGIPAQIKTRQTVPVAVLLPQVPGRIDAERTRLEDSDYVILGAH
jgi:uncharacterized iron-regulated protein